MKTKEKMTINVQPTLRAVFLRSASRQGLDARSADLRTVRRLRVTLARHRMLVLT